MGHGSSTLSIPLKELAEGDIILIRTSISTSLGQLNSGVLRGVAASQRSNQFATQEHVLAGWSHCGIVLRHKEKLFLAMATLKGIELYPCGKHLKAIQKTGGKVAVRQLQLPKGELIPKVLSDLLQAAVLGCEWDRYLPEMNVDNVGRVTGFAPNQALRLPRMGGDTVKGAVPSLHASRTSDGHVSSTASTRSDLTPFARELIRLFIPRIWAALTSLPPTVELELKRAFKSVDLDHDDVVSPKDVQAVLQSFKGAPVSKTEADTFLRLMDIGMSDALTFDDFVAGMARRPVKEIPLDHDIHAIISGEFVATIYEMMGLLPMRTANVLRTPHLSARVQSGTCVTPHSSAGANGTPRPDVKTSPRSIVADGSSVGEEVSPPIHALSCGVESPVDTTAEFKRHLTASDVLTAVKTPTAVKSRHAGRFHDGESASPSGVPSVIVPSTYDGSQGTAADTPTSIRADGVDGIASSRVRQTSVFHSPTGPAQSPAGLPPLAVGRRASIGSTVTTSSAGGTITSRAHNVRGTVIVIDSTVGDFRHFTPMSFSSLHEPKLSLLRGRLQPECLIDVSSHDMEEAHAREMVKAMTANLRSQQLIIPTDALAPRDHTHLTTKRSVPTPDVAIEFG